MLRNFQEYFGGQLQHNTFLHIRLASSLNHNLSNLFNELKVKVISKIIHPCAPSCTKKLKVLRLNSVRGIESAFVIPNMEFNKVLS